MENKNNDKKVINCKFSQIFGIRGFIACLE